MSLSKRDTFVRWLDPLHVFWEDPQGAVHANLKNACAAFNIEPTEENQKDVGQILEKQIRQQWPDSRIENRIEPDSPDYFKQHAPGPRDN